METTVVVQERLTESVPMRLLFLSFALPVLALGCSGKTTPTPSAEAQPTLKSALAEVGADTSLTDEQAVNKMAQVLTQRADELHILRPAQDPPKVTPVDGGWSLDLHLRDFNSQTAIGTPEQIALETEKTNDLTLGVLAGEVSELLAAGEKRHLKSVRVSVYTPAKRTKDGPSEQILVFRVRATPADAAKILNWRIWPNGVATGQPRDEAAKKKLQAEMWTVEVNEYSKISLKKDAPAGR